MFPWFKLGSFSQGPSKRNILFTAEHLNQIVYQNPYDLVSRILKSSLFLKLSLLASDFTHTQKSKFLLLKILSFIVKKKKSYFACI